MKMKDWSENTIKINQLTREAQDALNNRNFTLAQNLAYQIRQHSLELFNYCANAK